MSVPALTISATELGGYAGFRFCARCAWIRMHLRPLPWQGFPGIFSSIDRFTKQVIVNHLERESRLPPWLDGIGEAVQHLDPPHWSKFQATDDATAFTLRGEADAVFILADGTCAIVDYKTSRYNPDNRSQHRVYRAQLNAYAWIAGRIASRLDFPPVSRLALAYMEPGTDDEAGQDPNAIDADGFSLGFRPRLVEVDLDPERLLPPLLRQAARLHALPMPPEPQSKCRDCTALQNVLDALGPQG
jgi:hypothetical protein